MDEFNARSKIVKLKIKRIWMDVVLFGATLELQDPYVNPEPYQYMCVYLSEKFYRDIEILCEKFFHTKPEWSSARVDFWVKGVIMET